MEKQKNLSDPITLRLPIEVLRQIEEVAKSCDRSRSWVMVRALKSYLAAEGQEIIGVARARAEIDAGEALDFDEVINNVDAAQKGAAA